MRLPMLEIVHLSRQIAKFSACGGPIPHPKIVSMLIPSQGTLQPPLFMVPGAEQL